MATMSGVIEMKDETKGEGEMGELQERLNQLKNLQRKTFLKELADLADKLKEANETVKSLCDAITKKKDEIEGKANGNAIGFGQIDSGISGIFSSTASPQNNDDFLSNVYEFINIYSVIQIKLERQQRRSS